jgi:DNA-binding GntR family transcriptional regulator
MANITNALSKYRTMKHLVYDELRRLIVNGEYAPGTRLVTESLAKQLGVSHTPIREALHQLEAEGLVKVNPHHGAEVTQLSNSEIIEIYHIRSALERLATRLGQPNLTPADYERLYALLDEMDAEVLNKGLDRILVINHEFHKIIWESARSPHLYDLLENFYDASQRFRNASLTVPGRLNRISHEHRRIVQALQAGEVEMAARCAEEHYEGTAQYLLHSLRNEIHNDE